jgi:endonuclease III
MLLGILRDGSSERMAAMALASITRSFVDWNEVRVSSACEIAAAMPRVDGAMEKAAVIRRILQKIYDLANELSLDFLKEKTPRDAARLVSDVEGFPESALARATLLSLGHEVLPLTPRVLTVCRRLGILDDSLDPSAMLNRMQKVLPRPAMFEFHWLLSQHANKVCLPAEPICSECKMRSDCRAGRGRSSAAKASGGSSRAADKCKKRSGK